jgi:hypothetical protein
LLHVDRCRFRSCLVRQPEVADDVTVIS